MSPRGSVEVARSLQGLSLLLSVLTLVLMVFNRSTPALSAFWSSMLEAVAALSYCIGATVGAVILCRRPGNPIGWIVCASAVVLSLSSFAEEYALYALLATSGFLPAGEIVAWVGSWSWEAGAGAGLFSLLLFPDGRLPSRRWRPVAWLLAVNVAAYVVLAAVTPGTLFKTPCN
jgi:two-component system NarL family sensor kinase